MANVAPNMTHFCTHNDCARIRTVFTTSGARRRHEREIHGPKMRCDRCEFTTYRRYRMKKHKADAHPRAEDPACNSSIGLQPPPEYNHEHDHNPIVASSNATGNFNALSSNYAGNSSYPHRPKGPTATLQPSHDPTADQVNPNQDTFAQHNLSYQENYAYGSYYTTIPSYSSPVSDQDTHYDPSMVPRYPGETE